MQIQVFLTHDLEQHLERVRALRRQTAARPVTRCVKKVVKIKQEKKRKKMEEERRRLEEEKRIQEELMKQKLEESQFRKTASNSTLVSVMV